MDHARAGPTRRPRRPVIAAAIAVASSLLVVVAGCGDGRSRGPVEGVYLSLGDSYAMGYQPVPPDAPEVYRHGFAYRLPALVRADGYRLRLVNLGCGGATVAGMTYTKGCLPEARSPGGPVYTSSQLDYAVHYLRRHPGAVKVITMVVGLNDLGPCWNDPDLSPCVARASARIRPGLDRALARLRAAAGPDTVVVGLTYPNVFLGGWTRGGLSRTVARRSVAALAEVFNPMLKGAYEEVDGIFVDVTSGTGSGEPLDETTTLAPYGRIPVAVAQVCTLTWACTENDVHPRPAGQQRIAELVADALPGGRPGA